MNDAQFAAFLRTKSVIFAFYSMMLSFRRKAQIPVRAKARNVSPPVPSELR